MSTLNGKCDVAIVDHLTALCSMTSVRWCYFQLRDISEKTVQLVERLSSALLNVRPPHAKPLLLSTSHFTLRLFKESLEDLASLQLPALSHHLAGRRSAFQLPRLTFLAAHHKVVGIQVEWYLTASFIVLKALYTWLPADLVSQTLSQLL